LLKALGEGAEEFFLGLVAEEEAEAVVLQEEEAADLGEEAEDLIGVGMEVIALHHISCLELAEAVQIAQEVVEVCMLLEVVEVGVHQEEVEVVMVVALEEIPYPKMGILLHKVVVDHIGAL